MSDINANIVIAPIDLNVVVSTNQLSFTPEPINMTVYSGGLSAVATVVEAPIGNVHITGGSNGYVLQTDGTGNLDWAQYANANYVNATISNVHISGGTNGYVLQTDGTGNLNWTAMSGGGGGNGTPGGANTQVQYNNEGAFAGEAGFTYNQDTNILSVPTITATAINGTLATANQPNVTKLGTLSELTVSGFGSIATLRTSATSIALGTNSNAAGQGVSIGFSTGEINPGDDAIAIGDGAGSNNQGATSIAIGGGAGRIYQGAAAVAVGSLSGYTNQSIDAVALGHYAGYQGQGNSSIAIGANAGYTSQSNNSIILNATGANLNGSTANAFYVKPIRNANTANLLFYNNTTGEITYNAIGNSIDANTANYANYAGNVTISNQPNITNVGVLTQLAVNNNITATRFTSNVPTGTAPFTVSSSSMVGNLKSQYAENADGVYVSNISTGTYYLTMVGYPYNGLYNGVTANTLLNYNVATGNLSMPGSVIASNFQGGLNGYVLQNNQPYIANIGTLTYLNVSSTISASNVQTTVVGNGSSYYNTPTAGGNTSSIVNGAVVQTWLWATGGITGSNINGYLNATGNISGNYIKGNGSQLTSIVANSANTAGTVTTAAQPNITSVGTLVSLNVTGALLANGDTTVGNGANTSNLFVYGNTRVQGNYQGGLSIYLNSTTGNIQGTNVIAAFGGFYGPATGLTSIPGGNVTGSVPQADNAYVANVANYAGNVTVAAQSNITSLGTLTSLTVTGNTTSGNIISNNYVKAKVYVTANIGSASTLGAGTKAFVSDATSTTFAAAYTGGGGNTVPVYSDGSAWRIG